MSFSIKSFCFIVVQISLLFLHIVTRPASTDSVTLYDTQKTKWENWTTKPDRGGWTKQSVRGGGAAYGLCTFVKDNPDNWIRSSFVPRQEGESVHVTINFSMRSCKNIESKRLKHCEDTLQLFYYESDSRYDVPAFDEKVLKYKSPVAPDKKWDEGKTNYVNQFSISIPVSRRGLYIALRDRGACAALLRIRLYYLVCPAQTSDFTIYPRTACNHGYDVRDVVGKCVPGAQVRGDRQPSRFCKGNGNWHLRAQGSCECKPGFQPRGNTSCTACAKHFYKDRSGGSECHPCPQNSGSVKEGATSCTCLKGYYRNLSVDKANSPCTRPPGAPRNLRVLSNDGAKLELIWNPPANLGGRSDIYYEVSCDECPSSLQFLPGKRLVSLRKVTIQGLLPDTVYRFTVTALNGVSEAAKRNSFINHRDQDTIEIRTKPALPNKIKSLRVKVQDLDSIKVEWKRPGGLKPSDVDRYEVKINPAKHADRASYFFTNKCEYHLKKLTQRTAYSIRIRTKTNRGWGDYSEPLHVQTGANVGNFNGNMLDPKEGTHERSLLIGVPLAVFAGFLLIVLLVVLLARRGHLRFAWKNKMSMAEKNSPTECSMIPYSNIVFPPITTVKTYVDPHTYEDPNIAIREFAKEIEPTWITIESVIGGGEFGDVCRGRLRLPGRPEGPVAIKTLKAGASEKNRQDFLWEASIMGQFDNPNVIALMGVVTKAQPVMIITEFMENGSLDSFLRLHDGQLTPLQLVGILRGIGSGMRYLAGIGYVHRDLAARNVLVDSSLVCKVADFGLSREVEISTDSSTDGAYTTKGGKIPVRWTAPEAIHYRKFTSASDVWSYGVLMWEVMSFGERPYWNWTNQDVIEAIEKNYRLPAPMGCPETVHLLMLHCWEYDRRNRPRFDDLVQTLDQLIRAPDSLRPLAACNDEASSTRPLLPTSTSMNSVHRWDNVAAWLTSLKLERYISLFLHHGITTMDFVLQLSHPDLVQMGIHPIGHQKKILESVALLRIHLQETQLSDGFLV